MMDEFVYPNVESIFFDSIESHHIPNFDGKHDNYFVLFSPNNDLT